jgi:hypothetical protein
MLSVWNGIAMTACVRRPARLRRRAVLATSRCDHSDAEGARWLQSGSARQFPRELRTRMLARRGSPDLNWLEFGDASAREPNPLSSNCMKGT